jgi:phosphatidylglycerophosphate synthase
MDEGSNRDSAAHRSEQRVAAPAMARRPLKTRSAAWPKTVARLLIRVGLTPNQISALSIVFALVGAAAFVMAPSQPDALAVALLLLAALMIQFRLLCNLVDGLMAVEGGMKSPTGNLYNDLPDRISDVATLLAVGYSLTDWSWGPWNLGPTAGPTMGPTMGWLAALCAVMTAYIRVLGGAAGATQYFIGPMAKQQRMGLLTGAAVLAAGERVIFHSDQTLRLALVVIVIGSVATCIRRLRRIAKDLNAS